MSVPMDPIYLKMGMDPQMTMTTNGAIDVSDIRTVKVSNISLAASERDIKEFFSFSGDIEYIEMQSESGRSQLAYVTFKDSQGSDTALLLSGATIVDLSVSIMPVENYQMPPPEALAATTESKFSAVEKAEDMVSTMLAKGFVLGKDAISKARAFDDRHQLISSASATVASLDRQMGLSEKIRIGTAVVNGKAREVDERFQVSDITRSALSAAGSALIGNRYVMTGATWVSAAVNRVAKATGDVSLMTREKVRKVEEEKEETVSMERKGMVNEFAQIHLDESNLLPGELSFLPVNSHQNWGSSESYD